MSDEMVQLFRELLIMLAGGFITYIVTHVRPRQVREDTHDEAQTKTIEAQGRTLADAWTMIEKQEKRIDEMRERISYLSEELKKYVNAYARAIRFIRDKLPDVEVPDFLMESKPRIKKDS